MVHQKCFAICITFSHSHTNGRGNHARHQPAHWDQLGVHAQGNIDTLTLTAWRARDQTRNLSDFYVLRPHTAATFFHSESSMNTYDYYCVIDIPLFPVEIGTFHPGFFISLTSLCLLTSLSNEINRKVTKIKNKTIHSRQAVPHDVHCNVVSNALFQVLF